MRHFGIDSMAYPGIKSAVDLANVSTELYYRLPPQGEKGVRSQIGVLGKLSWPSSGPEGYFKALFLSGCGYPVLGPEGTTALDAFLQRCFLFLRYRFIHALNPARQSLHRPC